ncbi:hypothetical protein [Bosea sp. (in: a-proteobacteria)]|uniref:hypothetical protein n=1 Tax=Bosea sp. (in: a-proteobacteria) TaxID=1871050 RepID=UPI003B3A8BCF
MTDTAEQPLPTLVDVTPQPGRRVRTPDGSLLPEGYVLRGEPRSPYWLRAEKAGDVALAAHQPEPEAVPAEEPAASPPAPVEPPLPADPAPPASEKPGRQKF